MTKIWDVSYRASDLVLFLPAHSFNLNVSSYRFMGQCLPDPVILFHFHFSGIAQCCRRLSLASWESQVIHDLDSYLFAGKLETSEYDSFQF